MDLVIVAVPAQHVPRTVRALGEKKVAAAVVFSSGFSELGEPGVQLDRALPCGKGIGFITRPGGAGALMADRATGVLAAMGWMMVLGAP